MLLVDRVRKIVHGHDTDKVKPGMDKNLLLNLFQSQRGVNREDQSSDINVFKVLDFVRCGLCNTQHQEEWMDV